MCNIDELLRKPGDSGEISILFVGGPNDGEVFSGHIEGPRFSVDDSKTEYQLLLFETKLAEREFNSWVAMPIYWGEDNLETVCDILAGHLAKVIMSHGLEEDTDLILQFKEQAWNEL